MSETTTPNNRQPDGCMCPYGIRPLGLLNGINMGNGRVRLQMTRGCPVHDPASHAFDPAEVKPWSVAPPLCGSCGTSRQDHHARKATS